MRTLIASLLLAALPACAGTGFVNNDGRVGGDGTSNPSDQFVPGDGSVTPGPIGTEVVYAHSASELFEVNPDTLQVRSIGLFKWPTLIPDQMTDIAIDRKGKMIGISFDRVYRVDPKTAACTELGQLDRQFNGLSFVASAANDSAEVLVASAQDGSLYRVNPDTGQSVIIGNYGGGLGSSGDIVSVRNFGTVATVTRPGSVTDWLANINPDTGVATLIGDTGVSDIWGLGFWKNKVYGFTEGRQFVLIDTTTGAATPSGTSQAPWWGAGVTTVAPVVQ
ncbi:MAG: hypothetical protein KC503_37835 [Myxococcales bacterium]|nr:hypothetical protein [Myxococcales bacterium]